MILTEQQGTVLKSNDVVSNGFRIKASRKAFEILSAGLYSDKVTAIIRELSTNAADAHVAAGKKDLPFKVHLPNSMEPWFAVEDYGTGLSDEAMNTVYTTYFESNKTGSNDFTGALGLGSKSPFSYTDSFTVESRVDGVVRVYNAYLNEDGLPSIAKMTEGPTDARNGLTVRFPVNSSDFYAFKEKAERTLRWFSVRPTVTGNTIKFSEDSYLRKTDWYSLTSDRVSRSYVVMGNIAYLIDAYEFIPYGDHDAGKLRQLVEWGIELYVNIGDVDIAASREKLSYDKATVALLRSKLTAALADLETEITKDISTQPTIWKARQKLSEVRKSFQGFNFSAEWNGEKINDFVKIGNKEIEILAADGVTVETRHVPLAVGERLSIKSKNAGRLTVKKGQIDTVYADGIKIFLADASGAYASVRRYLEDQPSGTSVILLSNYDQEWLDETGISEVAVKTSTLPKPVRVAYSNGRGGKTTVKAKVYEFVPSGKSGNGGTTSGGYWKPAEVDVDEQDGVYVEILYFNARHQDGEPTFSPHLLNSPLNLLGELGNAPTLYGIRPSDKALVDEAEGEWLTLKDYIAQRLEDLKPDHEEDYRKAMEYANLGNSNYRRIYENMWKATAFDAGSVFGTFIKEATDAEKASRSKGAESYGRLLSYMGKQDGLPYDRLANMQEAVFERYPLLKHLDRWADGYASAVTEYVKLIDKTR